MKNYTERHHAFISAMFYKCLKEENLERYAEVFKMAVQLYGQQRGSRMAQRALRDGKDLNFATYRAYSEWRGTEEAIKELNTRSTAEKSDEDMLIHIWGCPWATQYKDMGLEDGGRAYCDDLDAAITRGFNPCLTYDVNQVQYGDIEYCIHYQRKANPEQVVESPEDLPFTFEYHCAHTYYTFSKVVNAIYKSEGVKISAKVLDNFAKEYGKEMADKLTAYKDIDFSYI